MKTLQPHARVKATTANLVALENTCAQDGFNAHNSHNVNIGVDVGKSSTSAIGSATQ